ncbi:maleylpyruvate isomerase family mycothiol-dependent enzyme [Streptomyces sp. JH34]|uniref:maleylpyruvate isomerase family mycothiol-dependent enzyme n=1 Tax=Streptomyces sp. JH34 TaxID=2793633 RepID=UPI0023FA281F|nr:maleylpyruvate isomerase family mycothiol-dependent enzyme [Streptomyces sp. JH34]MDF6019864.1 maleylpyruvate isomerase family mycothiol-dependent enzyme [Streptomyces sp. JH34]
MTGIHTWSLLLAAHDLLRAAVASIPADGRQRPTPAAEWNVVQVVQHAAGDQLAFASTLTGRPGPAQDPFAPSPAWDGELAELLDAALTASAEAFAALDPSRDAVPVPLPPFEVTAATAVGAAALDAAVHAWDIAVATGRPSPLTDELARRLAPAAKELVEPLRGFAYGPAIEAAPGVGDASALLNHLGRDAGWRPEG